MYGFDGISTCYDGLRQYLIQCVRSIIRGLRIIPFQRSYGLADSSRLRLRVSLIDDGNLRVGRQLLTERDLERDFISGLKRFFLRRNGNGTQQNCKKKTASSSHWRALLRCGEARCGEAITQSNTAQGSPKGTPKKPGRRCRAVAKKAASPHSGAPKPTYFSPVSSVGFSASPSRAAAHIRAASSIELTAFQPLTNSWPEYGSQHQNSLSRPVRTHHQPQSPSFHRFPVITQIIGSRLI
jgi:hypothetical protein